MFYRCFIQKSKLKRVSNTVKFEYHLKITQSRKSAQVRKDSSKRQAEQKYATTNVIENEEPTEEIIEEQIHEQIVDFNKELVNEKFVSRDDSATEDNAELINEVVPVAEDIKKYVDETTVDEDVIVDNTNEKAANTTTEPVHGHIADDSKQQSRFFTKVGKALKSAKSKVSSFLASETIIFEKKKIVSTTLSDKGTDERGNLTETLCTTYLIRHIDISTCDHIHLTLKTKDCILQEVHLFERFV